MTKKSVTIKTLAEKLSVTPATISKALRNADDISEKMKLRVRKLANELGYIPNLMARNLVSGKSCMIAVLVPNLSTSFFGYTLRGINSKARKLGYETMIFVHEEDYKEERKQLEFLSGLQIGGLILDSVPGNHNLDLIKNISEKRIPVVFIDRRCDQINADSVITNDKKAGYSITQYMINNGRKNIAFIGSVAELAVANDRYIGYKNALGDSKIRINHNLLLNVDFQIDEAVMKDSITKFIDQNCDIDAVICAGGIPAYITGIVLTEKNIKIPEQIELGEFGDNNIVHRLGVPFVTVNQHPSRIGQKAFDLLYNRISNPISKNIRRKHIFIKSHLIYHIPATHEHKTIEEIR